MNKEPTSQKDADNEATNSKPFSKAKSIAKAKSVAKAKTTAKVKTAKKAKTGTTQTKRETLVSLRAHVDRVEARLKRADTLTRKSIKAIETSFETLAEQSKTKVPTGQALTTRTEQTKDEISAHVQMLTGQLSRMVEKTRKSVTTELSGALETSDLNHLKSVLNVVDEQITETDMKLSRAISSINRNIADIATAVDSQIKSQAVTQKKAVDDLRSETEKARYALIQKLERIEQDSAHAIRTIGDKVSSATHKIKEESDVRADVLRDDVTKIVETTQLEIKTEIKANLDALKRDIQTRMDALESDHAEEKSQRARGYKNLETRIESLEFGLNSVTETVISPESASIATAFDDPTNASTGKDTHKTLETIFGTDMFVDTPKNEDVNPIGRTGHAQLSIEEMHARKTLKTSGLNGLRADENSAVTSAFETPEEQTAHLSDDEVDIQTFLKRHATPEHDDQSTDTSLQTDSAVMNSTQDTHLDLTNPYSTDFEEIQAIAKNEAISHPPLAYPSSAHSVEPPLQAVEYNTAPASPVAYNSGANISNMHAYADSSTNQSQHPQNLPPQNALGMSQVNAYNNNALSAGSTPVEYVSPPIESISDLPYENPAYADPAYNMSDDSMATARPGAFNKKRKSKTVKPSTQKAPRFSTRNKRTIGFALGVTAVSLVGIQLLSDKTPKPGSNNTITASNAGTNEILPATQNSKINMVETIGDYADNKGTVPTTNAAGFKDLESAAKAGDAIAQFQLGLSYLQNGRTNDAVKLIRLSADSGLAAAQYRLAKLYEVGEGVAEDPVMARTLTERAARTGNRIAMHDLALYYAEGRGGVNLDMVTAAKWFEKAADRGVVDSQFNLGVLFESGQGLPQNLTDAYVWYSIAAKQGDQLAAQQLAVISTQLNSNVIQSADARVKNFKPTRIDKQANGIFENVPWAVKGDKTAEINRIKLAQDLLSDLGYDAGTPDGAMGPRTRTAIMSFEKTNNLPETGRVSTELLDRLTLAAGA